MKTNANASQVKHISANGLAKSLISWLDKNNCPPSVVLTQGLYLARSDVHDGLPVDQLRPHVRNNPKDNQLIVHLMNALRAPGANRVKILEEVLAAVWVKKTVKLDPEAEKKKRMGVKPAGKKNDSKKPFKATNNSTTVVSKKQRVF